MAQRRRDPKREELWRERFARWRASGQSVRAFCAAEGVHESAWYFWRRELKRRSAMLAPSRSGTPAKPGRGAGKLKPNPPAFVPVTVLPAASGVEVRCPTGHVVTLPSGDAATLRTLFAALSVPEPC